MDREAERDGPCEAGRRVRGRGRGEGMRIYIYIYIYHIDIFISSYLHIPPRIGSVRFGSVRFGSNLPLPLPLPLSCLYLFFPFSSRADSFLLLLLFLKGKNDRERKEKKGSEFGVSFIRHFSWRTTQSDIHQITSNFFLNDICDVLDM